MEKVYLGDSVYAAYDGYHIVLTTENGRPTDPSNAIALDPYVVRALTEYVQRVWAASAAPAACDSARMRP